MSINNPNNKRIVGFLVIIGVENYDDRRSLDELRYGGQNRSKIFRQRSS